MLAQEIPGGVVYDVIWNFEIDYSQDQVVS